MGNSIHYIKIAFRNMRRYRIQTVISVISLAVGFTCFALSMLWIRYEMSYDGFHKNAKLMYVVYRPGSGRPSGLYRNTAIPYATYLKATFPEIANAAALISTPFLSSFPSYLNGTITIKNEDYQADLIMADSSFFRMFDIQIVTGRRDFLIPGSNTIAITQKKAQQLFGKENPIGKTINIIRKSYIICAIVAEKTHPSNYPYDILLPFNISEIGLGGGEIDAQGWGFANAHTIIELFPGTNVKAFEKKLYEHKLFVNNGNTTIQKSVIKPLTKIHYIDPDLEREVQFQYIMIFALCGLLVVLCSLFNYLISFVSRFRIRQKELALRVVCGASERSLLSMLSVEFILLLLISLVLGGVFMQLIYRPFLNMSYIQMDLGAIYRESILYIGSIILVSMLVFWLLLIVFRRRSLNLSIRKSNQSRFRSVSIVVQLIISIGFSFCTLMIIKQMSFLHQSSQLGFSYKNRGSITAARGVNGNELANKLKQIPEITNVVDTEGKTSKLVNINPAISLTAISWDDKHADVEEITLKPWYVSPDYVNFYDFRLLEGEMLTEADPEAIVLINESAAKAFNWHNPIGKQFEDEDGMKYTVKGVINNIYNYGPTIPVKPSCYFFAFENKIVGMTVVLFKFREGTWKTVKEKIDLLNENEFENRLTIGSEEEYEKFLKSENALLKLLSFMSAICLLVCVFGFVSMVSLSCEERRKSIAIRKINGATSGDILADFAKEYAILLIIGAAIAFSGGYYIIQRWLEHYMIQTPITVWTFLSIFFVFVCVVVFSVGWRVYKSSVENPAEIVKRD